MRSWSSCDCDERISLWINPRRVSGLWHERIFYVSHIRDSAMAKAILLLKRTPRNHSCHRVDVQAMFVHFSPSSQWVESFNMLVYSRNSCLPTADMINQIEVRGIYIGVYVSYSRFPFGIWWTAARKRRPNLTTITQPPCSWFRLFDHLIALLVKYLGSCPLPGGAQPLQMEAKMTVLVVPVLSNFLELFRNMQE